MRREKIKSDLSGEPVDSDLGHEVGEALAGLELVLAQHVGGQLLGRDQGGDQDERKQEEHCLSLTRVKDLFSCLLLSKQTKIMLFCLFFVNCPGYHVNNNRSKTNVALRCSEWTGVDLRGGVRYRAPYSAKKVSG